MSFPTEDELKDAFANITDPTKRDAAFHTIFKATQRFGGLAKHFRSSAMSFDDVRGEAMRKFLARKKPITANKPYAYLKLTISRIYLDEIRRERPHLLEYHENLDESQNEEFVYGADNTHQTLGEAIQELLPDGSGQIEDIVEHLCTQVLPGNCGRMKDVPDKVREMYHLFEKLSDGAPANFSAQQRKEHERVRLKVEDVVKTHVADEAERELWLGFVGGYLRQRKKHLKSD